MSDDVNLDLFEPFDQLLTIKIRGEEREVPENNTLLRGFQYLYGDSVVSGRFCWNNECGNCEVSCKLPGDAGTRTIRGCQALVEEGMEVTEVSPDLSLFVRD